MNKIFSYSYAKETTSSIEIYDKHQVRKIARAKWNRNKILWTVRLLVYHTYEVYTLVLQYSPAMVFLWAKYADAFVRYILNFENLISRLILT